MLHENAILFSLGQTTAEIDKADQIQDGLSMFFVWALVIVVAMFVLWAIAQSLRKHAQDTGAAMGFSFTLQDLRDMKEAGQLTDEEFERARQKIIGKTRQVLLEDEESSEGEDSQDVAGDGGDDDFESDASDESDHSIG